MENNVPVPGKGQGIASMVLGIIGVVCWFFGVIGGVISIVLGIIGLVLAGNAKKAGYVEGMQKAGFILSLISLIGGAIFCVAVIACAACVGAIAGTGALAGLS